MSSTDRVDAAPGAAVRRAGGPKESVRAHAVLVYFVLTFLFAWGGALLVVTLGPGHLPATPEEFRPYLPYGMLAAFSAPAVAGLLLTALLDGRSGLHELARRLFTWRVAPRWYAFALLTAPLAVLAVLLPLSLASTDFSPAVLTADGPAGLLLIGALAGVAAGFLEELGWTGFAVPRLRSGHGVLATGVLVGLVWGVWHFSYLVMRGSPDGGIDLALFLPEAVGMFLIVLPAYRVLLVWLYDRTNSLLVTMIGHASLSASTGLILAPSVTGAGLVAYYVALGALLWAAAAAVVPRRPAGNRSKPGQQGGSWR
jgi:membrane protease YdiL (CAAX protease family)